MNKICTTISLLALLAMWTAMASAQTPLWSVDGQAAGDLLGSAVTGLGDVDGDGLGDVAIAAPQFDGAAGTDCGRVTVHSGSDGHVIWTWEGEGALDLFGAAVTRAGDVDDDGSGDVVVGAPNHNGPAGPLTGKVYLYSGRTGLLMRSWDGEAGGSLGTGFGSALSHTDADNDGHDEILVGAPRFDGVVGSWSGKVYLYSAITGSLVVFVEGKQAFSYFGASVSGIGDLNQDLKQDFIVGAPYFSGVAPPYNGKAYAFIGFSGVPLKSWEGESPTSLFGYSVADAGDADSDGARDVAVGADEENAPGATNVGKVFLFSGISGSLIRTLIGDGNEDELFGSSLSFIGDVDLDNFGDLLVGARGTWGTNGWGYGAAAIYSGKTGAIIKKWTGEQGKDGLGVSVAGAGDTDGDGYQDVVVGASGHDGPGGFESGRAYVFSSNPSKLVFRPFGTSYQGTGGIAPLLSGTIPPHGVAIPAISVDQGLGAAHGLLWLGLDHGDVAFFGGHLYVDLGHAWWAFPIHLDGQAGIPGDGSLHVAVGKLADLNGLTLYLQTSLLDPGASQGLSLTNALEISVHE